MECVAPEMGSPFEIGCSTPTQAPGAYSLYTAPDPPSRPQIYLGPPKPPPRLTAEAPSGLPRLGPLSLTFSPSLLESSQGIREAKPPLPQSHPTSLYPPPPSPPPRFPLPLHLNLPHIALPPPPQLPLPPPSPQHPSSSTSLPRPTNSTPCQVLTYSPPSHNYHAPKPTPLPLFITPRATRAPSPLTTI